MTTSALSFSFSDDLIIKFFLLSNLPFIEKINYRKQLDAT
nr:MAG TPA: hypothetical protein [Caudoviricetes sp.]